MRCLDQLEIEWTRQGTEFRTECLLLDISRSGARVQAARRIPFGSAVRLLYPGGALSGTVRYCTARKPNFFLGVSFDPGSEWKRADYWPRGAESAIAS